MEPITHDAEIVRPVRVARPSRPPQPQTGFGLNDILFILFRQKWKIVICTVLGIAAAVAAYLLIPTTYESRAKLLVKYVKDRSPIDDYDRKIDTSSRANDSVITDEVQILTSSDLALEVIEQVGFKKVASKPDSPSAKREAIEDYFKGLLVDAQRGSNSIIVSYKNRNPEVAQEVLQALVPRYFDKHLMAHRSTEAFKFVGEQMEQVRSRLRITEAELKRLKGESGVLSLADTMASINALVVRSEGELLTAEAQLAEQQAKLNQLESLPGADASRAPADGDAGEAEAIDEGGKAKAQPEPVDRGAVERYKVLVEQLGELQKHEIALQSKYPAGSQVMKDARAQIEVLDQERRDIETKFPKLFATISTTPGVQGAIVNIDAERAIAAALAAKVVVLRAQAAETRDRATKFGEVAPNIAELERKREVDAANFKYYESSLEKARVDELLDPSKMPNISIVEKPTFGTKVTGPKVKIVIGLAIGGCAFGLALALLIELLLNRSVRLPRELQTRLGIPQILSIPLFPKRSRSKLLLNGKTNGSSDVPGNSNKVSAQTEIAPWDPSNAVRSFAEEIRDRLILWFKIKNVTHKPKLVGVAGVAGGEGVSTLAGSLAAVLSETGDGKVLLVDLNSVNSEAHPFFDGRPVCGLAEALEANGSLPPIAENLYVATGNSHNSGGIRQQIAAKRFYNLIPELKASHFDYIIFDMPPVTNGSTTLAMAGCLDKLLLVVEAERSDRHEVKRLYAELVAAQADVSAVLNKTKSSGPKWLNH